MKEQVRMEQKQQGVQQEEDVIDLGRLFKAVLKRWYLLVLCLIIGGGIGFAATKFAMTPTYTSTARMLVLTKETTITSLADLQIGSSLTGDYSALIMSPDPLKQTLEDLGLEDEMTYKELQKLFTINNPSNTRILEITCEDTDPARAAEIVNTHAKNSSDFISEVMEVSPPNVFSLGEVADVQAGPSTSKNTAIAAILGAIIAIIIIAVKELSDDRFKTEDDIEKYLGVTVLASIPDRSKIKGKN